MSDNVRDELGYDPAEYLERSDFWVRLVHPDDRPHVVNLLSTLGDVNRTVHEHRVRHRDGHYRWMQLAAMVVRAADGPPTEIVGYALDVTPRKEAEQALADRERYFRRLLEHASDIIAVVNDDGVVRYISPSIERVTGYRVEEMLGRNAFDFVHPGDVAHVRDLFRKGLAERGRAVGEFRHRHRAGHWVDIEAVGTAMMEGEQAVGAVINSRDVTDRKRIERDHAREQALRAAIETSMRAGVVAVDNEGRLTYVNKGFLEMTGFSEAELLGRYPPYPYWPPDQQERRQATLAEVLGGARERPIKGPLMRRSGEIFPATVVSSPLVDPEGRTVGWVGSVHDLTEVSRLEEQLRQAQKMEAVGRLAGGVAHDFNNMLTAILGYADLLLDQLPPGHPYRGDVEEVRRAGESAASLTRQLLAFSRRQVLKRDVLNLGLVVSETIKLLRRTIGEDIALHTVISPDTGDVLADRGQLEQVLMNLAVNARDAMPNGGELEIRTDNVTLDTPRRHGRWSIPTGSYVRLAVADTGHGMSPDVLEHVFEPFFTTRPHGKGTGLGLPTVYGIVKQSGGHIAFESSPDRGTTVYVYLTRAESGAVRTAAASRPPYDARPVSECVLVVEDEPTIRMLVAQVLAARGYTVVSARSGEEAETVAAGFAGTLHLLVTDVVMPGMSGTELARRIGAMHRGLRCLFMSGYTDDLLLQHGLKPGHTAFLQKPFTPAALLRTVGEVLDAAADPKA